MNVREPRRIPAAIAAYLAICAWNKAASVRRCESDRHSPATNSKEPLSMKISALALAFALAAGLGLTTAAFAQTNTQTAPAPAAAAPAKAAKPAHKTVQHKSEKAGDTKTQSSEAVKK